MWSFVETRAVERKQLGTVRDGVVVPYDSSQLEDGAEVEFVVRTAKRSEAYKPSHFSLQLLLAVTVIACCVALSPEVTLVLIFLIGGTGIGVACIRGAWTHRPTGWFSGVFFGFLLLLMMAATVMMQWRPSF